MLLGPVQALADDGSVLEINGGRLRATLARLALAAGEAVHGDSLIDGLWGEDAPVDSHGSLYALVYRLRRALRDPEAVESVTMGYRLAVRAEDVDAHRFEALAARGRRELAAGASQAAAASLEEALGLWRGGALADVPDAPFADTARVRLEELRVAAVEDRFEAELRLGRPQEILADLEAVAADHPLRERLAALRMRALHAVGRRPDALAVFEQVRRTLADELGVDPSQELRHAHLAVLRGEPAPRRVPEPAPGRLPAPLTGFVGRNEELELLSGLLDGAARLITVAGPGGVGKTRLALEAAVRHWPHGRDRVWLVRLADVDGRDGVAEAVLGALGSPATRPAFTARAARPEDQVAELLGDGRALLILDNCEHVIGTVAEFAARLLQGRPNLTILATSREPLDVMGESLCRLGPLDPPAAHADADTAAESAAVRLFLDRGRAASPGFELDRATTPAVVDIARRLDGLPLALELAAARLRSMTAGQIAERLGDRFRLLGSGDRTARKRTLHAVIGWSWDLLTERERILARRMAVFRAETGIAAIEGVCGDGTLPDDEIIYLLGALVDKSMVEKAGTRYRMLETIRAYAAEQLTAAGERETTRDRFVGYFAGLADEHGQRLRSAEQTGSLRLFEAEYGNLTAALTAADDAGRTDAAARLLGPLYWYGTVLRHDPRADIFVARVLRSEDELPEPDRAAFTALHVLAGGGEAAADGARIRAVIDDCARSGALERHPMLLLVTLPAAHILGSEGAATAERVTARARAGGDPWSCACTYLMEAFHHADTGDWEGGATARAAALRGFQKAGDRLMTALASTAIAQLHSIRGEHPEAIAAYERSIALAAKLGAQDEIGYRVGLATERMRMGDLAGARHDLGLAGRRAHDRGLRLLEVEVHAGLAELHRRRGEAGQADRELDRGEALAAGSLPDEAIGDWFAPARMANRLTADDPARARELLPRVVRAAIASRHVPPVAELTARMRRLEGDLTGAAIALGMSQAVRGAFDHGDAELREIAADLAGRLGRDAYEEAFHQGARMPRHDAVDRLTSG
ncbi:BTAD domain-containing putative transcriptional regulator [Actinomadura sp. KC345]|uniref:BTAD domain-containing putative transcriptional regulator n=1 Tax=Actinomadura sp. KC345 TaxID=2530371 RepID=UPI001FB5F7DF|nr:BTAD domain-containing putative transcriptional regulator [Actinomadura sp. KC345]